MEGALLLNFSLEFFTALPIILYAETHYRFPFLFSYLFKKEPEVIFDAPHRLEPNQPIPILLLVKDADRFSCNLKNITFRLMQDSTLIVEQRAAEIPIIPSQPIWWMLLSLDSHSCSGWVSLQISFTLQTPSGEYTYKSDNNRTSSHRPLKIFLSRELLPRLPNLYLGDAHTHSNYTNDQVEFGSPLEASRLLCKAMGLSFFAVTDHSYDLDDRPDNYLVNDPDQPKWKTFLEEAEACNAEEREFVILTGEEITCRNNNSRNVHLLLYGDHQFFKGSGDGAERSLHTWSEHSIPEILQQKSSASVVYASHPFEPIPFLQKLLLGRGEWAVADLTSESISGLQILNGSRDKGFFDGYHIWIQQLLQGKKLFLLAGNDAHGNFNRFSQLAIPFISIRERDTQLFGKMRTGVFIDGELSANTLLDALRNGTSVISDGPVAELNARQRPSYAKSESESKTVALRLHAVSSAEFGKIRRLNIFLGILGSECERSIDIDGFQEGYSVQLERELPVNSACYFRAEVVTSSMGTYDSREHFCYTNPVWITPA
ncbi:MAG: CehA/McbA family metallohydrolase [bacterium]